MAYKKSAETRAKIMESTAALFREKGYYDTQIKEIAQRSGVAHPCIYYYFQGKEGIARAIYDEYVEKVVASTEEAYRKCPDLLTNVMVECILFFRYITLNRVTQTVYFDIVQYGNYDRENLRRVNSSYYGNFNKLFQMYDPNMSESQAIAQLLTCLGFARALFKGMLDGVLDFSFEECCDYFFRHIILTKIRITEEEYKTKFRRAFEICDAIDIRF